MIEHFKASLEAQAQSARVIEGEAVPSLPPPVSAKILEPVGRHFGVPDGVLGVLDVLVPEVMLQGPRVVAIVGELEPTGVAMQQRCSVESAMNSMLAHRKNPVCHKSC